jgi:hypothetical protein
MWTIRRPSILRRLTDRLGIEPLAQASDMNLSPQVVGITNLDELLAETKIAAFTISVTANAYYTLATVPVGKRWKIVSYRISRQSGTYTFSYTAIVNAAGVSTIVDEYVAATSRQHNPPQKFPMDEGSYIRILTGGYSVTGDLELSMLYEEEDAF